MTRRVRAVLASGLGLLSLTGCGFYSLEERHLVFATDEGIAIVEDIVRPEAAGAYATATMFLLFPTSTVVDGESYVGVKSEEKVDCVAKRAMHLTVRGVLPDGTEASQQRKGARDWLSPPADTPLGKTIQAVCEPDFAKSRATHYTVARLRENYLKQLAGSSGVEPVAK